jgi:uncharacterized protein YdbL (DUF1318 family)
LSKVCEGTRNKIREVRSEREEMLVKIKTMELTKGRVSTEYSAKLKQFKAEREKEKTVKSVADGRKQENQRLAAALRAVNEEREDLAKKNAEAEGINGQLRRDLKICKEHLENVSRVNTRIKHFLESFMKTNTQAAKKLQRPSEEGWAESSYRKDLSCMGTGEGFFEKSI